ncbi:hypothetical protein BaRGS_00004806 [Batillaria attramentaria]|uniref:Uncharacterized protein n=1 Tax=Batillaria attramentaria TaxID=370345 RepID=A0ABD0LWU1_9CAEN
MHERVKLLIPILYEVVSFQTPQPLDTRSVFTSPRSFPPPMIFDLPSFDSRRNERRCRPIYLNLAPLGHTRRSAGCSPRSVGCCCRCALKNRGEVVSSKT